jgi:hypothetical protein
MKRIFFLLLLFGVAVVQAQNNPIFNGGNADGWNSANFAQTANNLFKGGDGDGWGTNSFLQSPNAIFTGGNGDGWSFSLFLQPGNAIFTGGEGDGWHYKNFLQPGNGIFNGGQGDGWASTYRPLGVLPVTMVTFTAEKQQTASLLKWQTSTEMNTASFDVERSSDAIRFTKIGTVAAAGSSSVLRNYQFKDAQPMTGTNYYRLKQIDNNGSFVYTPTRLVVFDASVLQKLKVYPIPATTLLNVELPQELVKEDVVLNLSNGLGVMVKHLKIKRNTGNRQTLNLSTLPPGVYTLQVSGSSYNGLQMIIKQ